MPALDEKVKHHLERLGLLIKARAMRRELRLPCFDLSVRIRWHMWRLRRAEVAAGVAAE